MHKYEVISIEIKKRIKEGYYPIDQPIPDEVSLAKEFSCSRMTLKRALDLLVMEGLVYRKRGHGTFIIKSAIQDNQVSVIDDSVVGLTKLLEGRQIVSEIIKFEVQFPSEKVATYLSIARDNPVYHIIRLRNVEDEPYVIEHTYMPLSLITGITEEVLHNSVYAHITDTLGLTIGSSHRKIRACKSDELDQQYLKCEKDDPILEVEYVGYVNTGDPFEYSFSRHRYDKFVYTTVNIKR